MARAIKVKVQVDPGELKRVQRQLKALGAESDEIRNAFSEAVDTVLMPALQAAAPGSMGSRIKRGAVGKARQGTAPQVRLSIRHPGAASYEFGRKRWYRGWRGRARGRGAIKALGGRVFNANPGQPERPWIGVKRGDHVLGATRPALIAAIEDGIERAWQQLGGRT